MKLRNVLSTIILILVLSITVGFSAFVSEMSISNLVAEVRLNEDVRITNVEFLSSDSYGVDPIELDYDKDSIMGNVTFNDENIAATYKITFTNFGNVDSYVELMENETGVNFEFSDSSEGVIDSLGGTKEITLLVLSPDYGVGNYDFKFNFNFSRVFNVSYEYLNYDNDIAVEGKSYSTYIDEYGIEDITVFMGGRQLSSSEYLYDSGSISISNVNGDIIFRGPKTLNAIMGMNSVLDTNVNFLFSDGLDVINNITYTRSGTENDEYPIYYYRGNVTANNVIFGDYCWKMVRTTETGGVKMIYNGVPAADGSCNNTGTASQIGTSKFNPDRKSPTYHGYMFGDVYVISSKSMSSITDAYVYGNDVTWDGTNYTLVDTMTSSSWSTDHKTLASRYHYTCFNTEGVCENVSYISNFVYSSIAYSITLSNGKTIEDAKEAMFSNVTDSTIKSTIDNWYSTNMTSYTSLLEDTIWCNDRTFSSGVLYSKDTSSTGNSNYAPYTRATGGKITLTCSNKRDAFTVNRTDGNNKLTYPVGLLTTDEMTLAGSGFHSYNTASYLNSGEYYWSMSPSHVDTGDVYVFGTSGSGGMFAGNPSSLYGVRPAISLMSNMLIASGDGSVSSPYRIKATFTINGSMYYYEPGMTWYEWLMSDYAGFSVTFTGDEKDSQMMKDGKHLKDDYGFVLSSYKIDSSLNYRFYDSGGSGD